MNEISRQLGQRIEARRRERLDPGRPGPPRPDFSYLNQLENGKRNPSLATLYKIATALGVPLKDIIPG